MTETITTLGPITLDQILAARERIIGTVLRTPLVRLNVDNVTPTIYLKLENLQPIGSFKLRGAGNAIGGIDPSRLARGVYTASAGNWAQGVAWHARRLGIPCTVIVPDHAPVAKLSAIERLGGTIIKVPYERWWQALSEGTYPDVDGIFISPVMDPAVIAGNGTIGLEIFEDLPEVDVVIAPYGGGGLSCGIASALRALAPEVRVFACEPETAAPLKPSLDAGSPQTIEYVPSFADGMGGKMVLPQMWPLASTLLAGSIVVSIEKIAEAVRLLAERNHVIAEGAGAGTLAAALSGEAGEGVIVCVISGGNIDASTLARILVGETP